MGIRYYFSALPKSDTESIKLCKTNADFINWAKSNNYAITEDDNEEPFAELFDFGETLYCIGRGEDWLTEMQANGNSIFSDDALKKKYEHYSPVIFSQSDFLDVIHNLRRMISEYYESLLDDSAEDEDNLTPDQRRRLHIQTISKEWSDTVKRLPFNTDFEKPCIVDSWMYEYSIFELVRIYKTFDWTNSNIILIRY